MEYVINVLVSGKVATAPKNAVYICGNSDYTVHFEFDDEWSAFDAKTARFRYGGKHQDVAFTGDQCPVPKMSNIYSFEIGVYAGDLHTTTPAYVPTKKSILCGSGVPDAPQEDVYGQLMELYNESAGKIGDLQKLETADRSSLVAAINEAAKTGGTAFETDKTLSLKDGILSVNTADAAEQDNTLPITSAAVHSMVGNTEELETEDKYSLVAAINEVAKTGGGTVDAELSTTSENSVQNKVVAAALNDKQPKEYCMVVEQGNDSNYVLKTNFSDAVKAYKAGRPIVLLAGGGVGGEAERYTLSRYISFMSLDQFSFSRFDITPANKIAQGMSVTRRGSEISVTYTHYSMVEVGGSEAIKAGQAVVVTNVDSNGVPTEFAAADVGIKSVSIKEVT